MVNMSRQEILVTTLGEMNDMISCLAIYNGTAKEKIKHKYTDFFDILRLN